MLLPPDIIQDKKSDHLPSAVAVGEWHRSFRWLKRQDPCLGVILSVRQGGQHFLASIVTSRHNVS
jgi:hypothetical protein